MLAIFTKSAVLKDAFFLFLCFHLWFFRKLHLLIKVCVCVRKSWPLIGMFCNKAKHLKNSSDGLNHRHDHLHDHRHGYSAYSHHDKIPPWWGNVSNDEGGNVPVSKTHHTPWWIIFWSIYVYQVTHITSGSFGKNFQDDLSLFLHI